jgi:hypothetical protein
MGIIIATHNMSKVAARITALHVQGTEPAPTALAGMGIPHLRRLPAR